MQKQLTKPEPLVPRWYQEESVDAIWRSLVQDHEASPLVCLPTGSGKSLVLAMLAKLTRSHKGRLMIMAHRKELLVQNHSEMQCLGQSGGLYSAGLARRDTRHAVIFGGIQSCFDKAEKFGKRHVILIDEAHLVPEKGEGMYRRFINDMKTLNPQVRIIGVTATPYRMTCGDICGSEEIFSKCVYEAPIARLITEGFLCDLKSKIAENEIDTSKIKISRGEYAAKDMERAFTCKGNVGSAALEIISTCKDKKSILIFTSGVDHCEQLTSLIEKTTGEEVGMVTGNTPGLLRDATLQQFKDGRLRWLVNVNVLTTGFDARRIDAIAVCRATQSAGLFAQMCGRGLRIHPDKENCLILDFGENLDRHGPLDHPEYGRKKKEERKTKEDTGLDDADADDDDSDGTVQTICPNCTRTCPPRAIYCPHCGYWFDAPHQEKSSDAAVFSHQLPSAGLAFPKRWRVVECSWGAHTSRKSGKCLLRVDYLCESSTVSPGNLKFTNLCDWVCLEHAGYARKKACDWWAKQSNAPVPSSVNDALDLYSLGATVSPTYIKSIKDGIYERVTVREFDDEIPEWDGDAIYSQDCTDPFTEDAEAPF